MAIRPLHLLGSPALREEAREVTAVTDETRQVIDDLFETMRAARGIGLAANQLGVLDRVCVVEVEATRYALVNPVIVSKEGHDVEEEGCLSIPDIYGDVKRSFRIEVEALDRDGKPQKIDAEGLVGRAIQHEIDHLDGIVFIDRLSLVKRRLALSKWKKARKGEKGHIKEVVPETDPAERRHTVA